MLFVRQLRSPSAGTVHHVIGCSDTREGAIVGTLPVPPGAIARAEALGLNLRYGLTLERDGNRARPTRYASMLSALGLSDDSADSAPPEESDAVRRVGPVRCWGAEKSSDHLLLQVHDALVELPIGRPGVGRTFVAGGVARQPFDLSYDRVVVPVGHFDVHVIAVDASAVAYRVSDRLFVVGPLDHKPLPQCLLDLPEDTLVYPGCGAGPWVSTIAQERSRAGASTADPLPVADEVEREAPWHV